MVLAKFIPGVKFMSRMDYPEFSKRGEDYLKEYWQNDKDHYELQKKGASMNFIKEQNISRNLVKNNIYENKDISVKDFDDFLEKYFIITLVNTSELYQNNYKGSHFIFIFDQTKTDFIFHDPGLPPVESCHISKDRYIKEIFVSDTILIPKILNKISEA